MYEVHLKGDGKEDKTIMDLIGALNQLKLKDASNCGPNCQSDKTPCPDACAGRSSIGYHITVPPKWIGDKVRGSNPLIISLSLSFALCTNTHTHTHIHGLTGLSLHHIAGQDGHEA